MELERALPRKAMSRALWALLFGNFIIGCGVMAIGGVLNDLTRDLNITVTEPVEVPTHIASTLSSPCSILHFK